MIHWISPPETEPAGHVLTESAPSQKPTILSGDCGTCESVDIHGLGRASNSPRQWCNHVCIGHVRLYNYAVFYNSVFRSMMDKDSRLLNLIYQFQLLNLCICGFLQALDVVQFYEMLPLTHMLMIITLLSLLRLLVSWLHSKFRWEARLMLSDFGALACCCTTGFLAYYLLGKGLYLIFFGLGILLLVASLLAVSIGYMYQKMVKSSQMHYYQKEKTEWSEKSTEHSKAYKKLISLFCISNMCDSLCQ